MTEHKHLEEVDTSTLSIEELTERLKWRAEHPVEVARYERELEARRRVDAEMEDVHEGFLASGGTEEEFKRQEKAFREEIVRERTKEFTEGARAEFARSMWRSF
jgi:hypothetical protein